MFSQVVPAQPGEPWPVDVGPSAALSRPRVAALLK